MVGIERVDVAAVKDGLNAITHHVIIAGIVSSDTEEVGGVGCEHPKALHGRDEVATKVDARVRAIDGLKGNYLIRKNWFAI